MPAVVDPVSGLEYYELSHRWGMYTPIFPGYEEIKLERITHHAKQGVMTHKITTIFHTSTHVNAPLHLIPGAAGVGELALDRFFGTGVVALDSETQMGPDRAVRSRTRQAADQGRRHRADRYRLAPQIFRQQRILRLCPGLEQGRSAMARQQAGQARRRRYRHVDHPLATSLGPHRNGPQIKYLLPEYKAATGREAIKDFPEWNPAHRCIARRRHCDHRKRRRRSR